jgi:hypothetical protein
LGPEQVRGERADERNVVYALDPATIVHAPLPREAESPIADVSSPETARAFARSSLPFDRGSP